MLSSICVALLLFASCTADCPDDNVFDFIVVGGGSSGAAVTGRLSEIPTVKVLLLEAGDEPTQDSYVNLNYAYINKNMKANYKTEPQKKCCLSMPERILTLEQGKALGGGSAVNGQLYTRGSIYDYDEWEKALKPKTWSVGSKKGTKEWSYDNVIKYFKKLENYQIPHSKEEAKYHNNGGPITVSWPTYKTTYSETFMKAGLELGYFSTDISTNNIRGFTFNPVNLKNDLRVSTFNAYLQPAMKRSNLKIWTNAFVTKITFNSSKYATGVLFQLDGQNCSASAKKEIILSAGALITPKLLMLSGVGPRDVLEKFKIPVIHHLPGVGRNLSDQVFLDAIAGLAKQTDVPQRSQFKGINSTEFLYLPLSTENFAFFNSTFGTEDWPDLEVMFSASVSKTNILRLFQAMAPSNSTDQDIEQQASEGYSSTFSDYLHLGPPLDSEKLKSSDVYKELMSRKDDHQIVIMMTILLRPKSEGYVTLRSADPFDPPIIDPNYLGNDEDLEALIQGLNETIRILQTNSFNKVGLYNYDFGPFFNCGTMNRFSKDYLKCMVQTFSRSGLHFVKSCKMASSSDPYGVVDYNLKVIGVKGLRISDASIIPVQITGHTNIPSVMVGEKASDLIKASWKL